eukprot:2557649-Prymnesium_polylepis.1
MSPRACDGAQCARVPRPHGSSRRAAASGVLAGSVVLGRRPHMADARRRRVCEIGTSALPATVPARGGGVLCDHADGSLFVCFIFISK